MKNNLLSLLFLVVACLMNTPQISAQTCSPDSQYTSSGIYPSDTLPDMTVGAAVNEVVHFVFPSDTVIFGFTLEFDSFIVNQLLFEPSWLSWDCDQNQNNCTYYTSSAQLTRGCAVVTGTPTQANSIYPAWDSIVVVGEGWVTVPFGGPQSAVDSIPIYYRVSPSVSAGDPLLSNLGLTVSPNPTSFLSNISFRLVDYSDVRVSIHDLQGREIALLADEKDAIGKYNYRFNASEHPAGMYFARIELNNGQFRKTQKILSVH